MSPLFSAAALRPASIAPRSRKASRMEGPSSAGVAGARQRAEQLRERRVGVNDAPGAIDRRDRDGRVVEEAREAHLRGPLSFVDFAAGGAVENERPGCAHPAVLAEGDAVIEAHRQELAVAAAQIEIEGLGAHAARPRPRTTSSSTPRRAARCRRGSARRIRPARGRSRATRRAWRSDRRWTRWDRRTEIPQGHGRDSRWRAGVPGRRSPGARVHASPRGSSRAPPDARSVAARDARGPDTSRIPAPRSRTGDRRISSEPVRCSRAACARR